MASLPEIFDTASLSYDTALGESLADSGSGPVNSLMGWIRTGGPASVAAAAGVGNCNNWNSSMGSDRGSVVLLYGHVWTTAATLVSPWAGNYLLCDQASRVWCAED
jgi:hypothetical protein